MWWRWLSVLILRLEFFHEVAQLLDIFKRNDVVNGSAASTNWPEKEARKLYTFLANAPILYPWKHQKIFGFMVFSGGYKMGKLARNGLKLKNYEDYFTIVYTGVSTPLFPAKPPFSGSPP